MVMLSEKVHNYLVLAGVDPGEGGGGGLLGLQSPQLIFQLIKKKF